MTIGYATVTAMVTEFSHTYQWLVWPVTMVTIETEHNYSEDMVQKLLTRLKADGIELTFDGHQLRYRSHMPIDQLLLEEMRKIRTQLIVELLERRPRTNAWLDNKGCLRIQGLLPKGCTILEVLVSLDASVVEIERHIHPIGSPNQWELWTGQRIGRRLAI